MINKEEWCSDTRSKLQNEDLRINTLNEIREHFRVISESEAALTAEMLELPLVFDCLNDSNQEQVDLACEVLSLCMEKLDIASTSSRYTIPLERALSHPNSGVKVMALDEIARITNSPQLVPTISQSSIFRNILTCIADDDLKVGARAVNIVLKISQTDFGWMNEYANLHIIETSMQRNEVIRLRFYEMFVHICVNSQRSHEELTKMRLMKDLLKEIDNADVLLKLNIIEMLTSLVRCDYGYNFLQEEGFIDRLFTLYAYKEDPLFLQLCEPGILKFYGHMAATKPQEAFEKHPQVIAQIFDNLSTNDYTMLKVSLETLAFISRGDKQTIDEFLGPRMRAALHSMGKRLQAATSEVKLLVLAWLEELLTCSANASSNCSKIAMNWFDSFGEKPMDLIANYVRNPFEELRLAGMKVLLALSQHDWGQENIRTNPAMIELLLDRAAETHKSCKDLKYAIIASLVNTNFGVFDVDTFTRFRQYLVEGPHFVPVITEVTVERGI